jgi:hypothetical protein
MKPAAPFFALALCAPLARYYTVPWIHACSSSGLVK